MLAISLVRMFDIEIKAMMCPDLFVHSNQRQATDVNPEAVLAKSHMECSTTAAFLHENMLEFVDEDAIEDAANACLYLSHSGK